MLGPLISTHRTSSSVHWLFIEDLLFKTSHFIFHRTKSYMFGTTRGWVDDRSFISGWTNPQMNNLLLPGVLTHPALKWSIKTFLQRIFTFTRDAELMQRKKDWTCIQIRCRICSETPPCIIWEKWIQIKLFIENKFYTHLKNSVKVPKSWWLILHSVYFNEYQLMKTAALRTTQMV